MLPSKRPGCRDGDKKLPTLLEGEAIAVWFELTAEEQGTYNTAKEKIRNPANGASSFRFTS